MCNEENSFEVANQHGFSRADALKEEQEYFEELEKHADREDWWWKL